jgi:hypothetical protein
MRRRIILWALLVMVFAAIAGWQEIKYRDEEAQTKALLHVRSPSANLSSPAKSQRPVAFSLTFRYGAELEFQ